VVDSGLLSLAVKKTYGIDKRKEIEEWVNIEVSLVEILEESVEVFLST